MSQAHKTFTGPDGTVWTEDRRYYLRNNEWVPYGQPTTSTASSSGRTPGGVTPSDLTAAFARFEQSPAQSHPPQLRKFGENPQIPGKPAVPNITLDASVRDAAKRDPFFAALVRASDQLANGER